MPLLTSTPFRLGTLSLAQAPARKAAGALGLFKRRPILALSQDCHRAHAAFIARRVPMLPRPTLHPASPAAVGPRLLIRQDLPAYFAANLYSSQLSHTQSALPHKSALPHTVSSATHV